VILALGASIVVAVALLFDLLAPGLIESWKQMKARRHRAEPFLLSDPGRERRAEQRARELLRSCVNDEEWSMYRELGFIRVWSAHSPTGRGGEVAYLVYPHRPVVSFLVSTACRCTSTASCSRTNPVQGEATVSRIQTTRWPNGCR
jgi:hypothetical protein